MLECFWWSSWSKLVRTKGFRICKDSHFQAWSQIRRNNQSIYHYQNQLNSKARTTIPSTFSHPYSPSPACQVKRISLVSNFPQTSRSKPPKTSTLKTSPSLCSQFQLLSLSNPNSPQWPTCTPCSNPPQIQTYPPSPKLSIKCPSPPSATPKTNQISQLPLKWPPAILRTLLHQGPSTKWTSRLSKTNSGATSIITRGSSRCLNSSSSPFKRIAQASLIATCLRIKRNYLLSPRHQGLLTCSSRLRTIMLLLALTTSIAECQASRDPKKAIFIAIYKIVFLTTHRSIMRRTKTWSSMTLTDQKFQQTW